MRVCNHEKLSNVTDFNYSLFEIGKAGYFLNFDWRRLDFSPKVLQ